MKLSAKAEYACLAVIELATAGTNGGLKPIREIAEAHGIPQQYLAQILLRLK
jgi:Rrf2 family transcriptional regulator, cysteine metabolism repressor